MRLVLPLVISLSAGVLLPACARVSCGEGTVLDDKACVVAEPVSCGEGTVRAGQQCVPDALACGPGTVFVDGACEAETYACGAGTVLRGGECVSVRDQWAWLPIPAGQDAEVSQGHHGGFSHSGSSTHALDLRMPEGTEVAAARGGRVLQLREDSDEGCGEPRCANLANYLVIDHGDGTLSRYYHLMLDGVLVEVGDEVEAGQVVALSGNTGWSTGPHLHFEVDDLFRQSLPLRFHDLEDIGGVAFAGAPLRSANVRTPNEVPPDWSDCPTDLFAFMGATLDPGLACTAVSGPTLALSGVAYGDDGVVAWAINPDGNGWDYGCEPTDSDGSFDVDVPFEGTSGGFLMFGQGDEDCSVGQSWAHSPWIVRLP